jgi:Na+/H+-dicarboxylate symporter/ABC-type amino acid transport substrate-binding protein
MKTEKKKIRMSLSTQVMIGLFLGIVLGVFFGELVGFLQVIGDAFILLLQMTVLPYIIVSLIGGLGRLDFGQARTLAIKAGLILLILWAIVLAAVILIPSAFPDMESASFFSTALVEERKPFDFLGLYIPANPFHSMANTIVPAIVLFSAALGLALIGIKNKSALIEQLDVLSNALMKITQFVARLAPVGVFALASSAAGTMDVEELGRLQVYLVTYAVIATLLSLWVLPGLVMVLTPVRYKSLIGQTRDALVTAFATGNLLIVLPILADKCKAMVQDDASGSEDASSAVDVLIPVSFNFPNMGKLLTLSFIPFAAWFVDISISVGQYPNFLVSGLASFFGEVVVAMPFLMDLMRIPSDMFELFITVDVLTGRFGTLLAAMHTVVLTVLGTFAMRGRLVIRWKKVLQYAVVTVVVTFVSIAAVRLFFSLTLDPTYTKYRSFIKIELLHEPVEAKVYTSSHPPPASASGKSALERILKRGTLRVGYIKDSLPFAFINAHSNLVGFDIEMAHLLAKDLGVNLEFLLIDRKNIAKRLNDGYCDIVMTGLAITTDRAQKMAFSESYIDQTLAFIIKDHRRDEFKAWKDIKMIDSPRIGIPDVPYFVSLAHQYLPGAQIIPLTSPREFLSEKVKNLDAFIYSAEAGSAWTLIYPDYSVVVPLPDPVAFPMAYPIARDDSEMVNFVNHWLTLKKKDKTIARIYDHWILGKGAAKKEPRWSVIRNVFHLIK